MSQSEGQAKKKLWALQEAARHERQRSLRLVWVGVDGVEEAPVQWKGKFQQTLLLEVEKLEDTVAAKKTLLSQTSVQRSPLLLQASRQWKQGFVNG